MHRVTIFKVNEVVTGLHKIEILPESELTRLTGEQEQSMVEQLVKPIKFRSVSADNKLLENETNKTTTKPFFKIFANLLW